MVDQDLINISTVIGSSGVGLLLLAFILNLTGKISEKGFTYLLMNALGAFMAAYYAWNGGVMPFVILEFIWGGTALIRMALLIKEKLSPE